MSSTISTRRLGTVLRTMGVVVALALVTGMASPNRAAAATPDAQSRSGRAAIAAVSLGDGAYASTEVACSQTMDWIRRTVTMRTRSGLATQAVAWRSYIQPRNGTGFWTAWTSATAPFKATYVVHIANTNLTVYMEYAWWNGRAWSYAGEWITSYWQVQGMSSWRLSYCAT